MKKGLLLFIILISSSHADWLEDAGLNELLDYYNLSELPADSGSQITVGLIEAARSGAYMPDQNDSRLSGTLFDNISNSSNAVSSHANTVARFFLENDASFVPGVIDAEVYEANDFLNTILTPGFNSNRQVSGKVYTAAFIANQAANTQIRVLDNIADEQNVLFITALNNGSNSPTPEVFATTYNTLTVGVTDRDHSGGDTPTTVDGGGRTKPDIVSNATQTSWSTGQVASISTYLLEQATAANRANYLNNVEVQRAVILAGATKEEFSTWSNNSTDSGQPRSLDPNYGAGEINAFHSSRIIENPESSDTYYGWDFTNISSASRSYTFTIPQEATSGTLNFAACWNRVVNISFVGTVRADPIADLRLELTGGDLVSPIVCDSAIDNVELIHAPNLTPGTYTVTVSRNGNVSADVGIAWRLNFETPELESFVTNNPDDTNTIFTNQAIEGVRYDVLRSTDLVNWSIVNTVIPDSNEIDWTDPTPNQERFFYRMKFWP